MPHPDTIKLLLTIIAFFCLVGMLKTPFYGLISYLIIMMARPALTYPALGRIELVTGILILIVIALTPGRLQRVQVKADPVIKWMFVLFAVMGLSMLLSFNFSHSLEWMYDAFKVFLFFLMVITLVDTLREAEIFLWVFSILTCAIAYSAIFNYMNGIIVESVGETFRVNYAVVTEGMGSGHVALANLTLQGMPVLWYLGVCSENRILKGFGFFLFLICLYAVVISGSRGGFVGLLVFGACLVFFSQNRMAMLLCGAAVMLAIPIVAEKGYMDYMGTILGLSDASSSSRVTGLRHGFEMLLKRPVLGVGPGCYPLARRAWMGWGLWAHNHYGELMGELGIAGTVVWFLFFKSYFMKAWLFVRGEGGDPALRNICLAVIVASIVRLVLGMGSHSVYIFFWYMMAGVVVNVVRIQTVQNEHEMKKI